MAQHKLNVGSRVQTKRSAALAGTTSFRVEKLVALAGGQLLYRIKCESEPFDRIVDEHEIIPHASGHAKKCASSSS